MMEPRLAAYKACNASGPVHRDTRECPSCAEKDKRIAELEAELDVRRRESEDGALVLAG